MSTETIRLCCFAAIAFVVVLLVCCTSIHLTYKGRTYRWRGPFLPKHKPLD